MNLFSRLPGFAKAPPGLEMEILRLGPVTFLLGTLVIALPSLVVRILLWPEAEGIKVISTLDFFCHRSDDRSLARFAHRNLRSLHRSCHERPRVCGGRLSVERC